MTDLFKEAERLLGHHEMRTAVERIVGHVAVDLETHAIVDANDRALAIFGYDALIGRQIHDLVPEGIAGLHRGHVASFAADPRARRMTGRDFQGRRSGGELIDLVILLAPGEIRGRKCGVAVILEVKDGAEGREPVS